MDAYEGPEDVEHAEPAEESTSRSALFGLVQYGVAMVCILAAKELVYVWWDDQPVTSDTLWTAALLVVSLAVLVRIKAIHAGTRNADEGARSSREFEQF